MASRRRQFTPVGVRLGGEYGSGVSESAEVVVALVLMAALFVLTLGVGIAAAIRR